MHQVDRSVTQVFLVKQRTSAWHCSTQNSFQCVKLVHTSSNKLDAYAYFLLLLFWCWILLLAFGWHQIPAKNLEYVRGVWCGREGREWRFGKSETAFGGWPLWEWGLASFILWVFCPMVNCLWLYCSKTNCRWLFWYWLFSGNSNGYMITFPFRKSSILGTAKCILQRLGELCLELGQTTIN